MTDVYLAAFISHTVTSDSTNRLWSHLCRAPDAVSRTSSFTRIGLLGFVGINGHNEDDFIAVITSRWSPPNLFHRLVSSGMVLPHHKPRKFDLLNSVAKFQLSAQMQS